uniref:DUF1877 family protein n=1 Tax=Thaumasiovibrio occultus TaxID=1891184 RepID=UPI00131BCD60|nr:DUF1877 family protein [Thaumasiovibrio occultus]
MGMMAGYKRVNKDELVSMLTMPDLLTESLATCAVSDDELTLDNSWQAIHFLLNLDAEEITCTAGAIVMGGEPISDDEGFGFGPVRYFSPEELMAITVELDRISTSTLMERFPQLSTQMMGYSFFDNTPEEAVLSHFDELRHFCDEATARGEALIVYLC